MINSKTTQTESSKMSSTNNMKPIINEAAFAVLEGIAARKAAARKATATTTQTESSKMKTTWTARNQTTGEDVGTYTNKADATAAVEAIATIRYWHESATSATGTVYGYAINRVVYVIDDSRFV